MNNYGLVVTDNGPSAAQSPDTNSAQPDSDWQRQQIVAHAMGAWFQAPKFDSCWQKSDSPAGQPHLAQAWHSPPLQHNSFT